jgi:hypothetical protein
MIRRMKMVVGDGWFDDDATDVTEVDHGNIDAGICIRITHQYPLQNLIHRHRRHTCCHGLTLLGDCCGVQLSLG